MTNIEVVVRYYWHSLKCKIFQRQIRAQGMLLYKLKSLERELSEKKAECVIDMIDEISLKIKSFKENTVNSSSVQ